MLEKAVTEEFQAEADLFDDDNDADGSDSNSELVGKINESKDHEETLQSLFEAASELYEEEKEAEGSKIPAEFYSEHSTDYESEYETLNQAQIEEQEAEAGESSDFFDPEIDLTDLQLFNIYNPLDDITDYFNLEENPLEKFDIPNINGGMARYLIEQHRESLKS